MTNDVVEKGVVLPPLADPLADSRQELAEQLVEQARVDGVSLVGPSRSGLLADLTKAGARDLNRPGPPRIPGRFIARSPGPIRSSCPASFREVLCCLSGHGNAGELVATVARG